MEASEDGKINLLLPVRFSASAPSDVVMVVDLVFASYCLTQAREKRQREEKDGRKR
jgi:hypothetical protein